MSPLGSAAGAARHYNLRLPTEGLRQGHGPAPGFNGLPPMPPTPEFQLDEQTQKGTRRQWRRKGRTPPKSGHKTAKNAPFASVPPGVETSPLEPSKDKEKAAAAGP